MFLTRRSLLQKSSLGAGGALLTPLITRLEAEAAGEARLPKRVIFVLQANGFQTHASLPNGHQSPRGGPDHPTAVPLANLELPEGLAPLTPFKDQLTIVHKLSGFHSSPYHTSGYAALAGTRKSLSPVAETIDAALAKKLPAVFPLVCLGLDDRSNRTQSVYVCSAWGADRPIATLCNPEGAYNTLFGSVAQGSGLASFNARTNLLDFMRDDVQSVRTKLAGPERERFDYYVHSFETMSDRQRALKAMEARLREHAPELGPKFTSANECHRLEAQFDLAAGALLSGLTNVVTICSGLCEPSGSFRGLGVTEGNHSLGHSPAGSATLPAQLNDKTRAVIDFYTRIRKLHMEQIAGLIRKLQGAREGNGTMWDNTLIVYTSDAADAHHSDGKNWPFLLIGSLGGRLRTGQFVEYPAHGRPGNRTTNALFCTLLHAAGAPRDHFNLEGGLRDIDRRGPLPELLA